MGGGTIRGWKFVSVAGLALCVAAGAIVGAAQVVGSGAFSMPLTGGTKDIWTGPATKPAGVKVKVTTGQVKVHSVTQTGTNAVPALGQVAAGNSCIFEGGFYGVRVEALSDDTCGEWENRAPTEANATDVDRLIGEGAVTMPSAGTVFNVYGALTPLSRVIAVSAGATKVGVRTAAGGSDLLTIDEKDTAFVSLGNASKFFLYAYGQGTHRFRVSDPASGGAPHSCSLCGKDGETDRMYADGTRTLSIVLYNAGPGTVTLSKQMSGGSVVTEPIGQNASSSACAGPVVKFEWTYAYTTDPTAKTRVDVEVTGH